MANKEMTLEQCKKELELEKGQVEILMKMIEERNNELDDRRKKMNDLKELLVSKSCTYEDIDFYNGMRLKTGIIKIKEAEKLFRQVFSAFQNTSPYRDGSNSKK